MPRPHVDLRRQRVSHASRAHFLAWPWPFHKKLCCMQLRMRLPVSQHLPEYYKILQDDLCSYLCPDGSQWRAPSRFKNCKPRLWVDPSTGLRKHFFQVQGLLQHRTSGKGMSKDFLAFQTLKGHMVDGSPSWALYRFIWGANTTRGYRKTSARKHFRGNPSKHGAIDHWTNSISFYNNNGKLGKTLGDLHPRTMHCSLSRNIRMEVGH